MDCRDPPAQNAESGQSRWGLSTTVGSVRFVGFVDFVGFVGSVDPDDS